MYIYFVGGVAHGRVKKIEDNIKNEFCIPWVQDTSGYSLHSSLCKDIYELTPVGLSDRFESKLLPESVKAIAWYKETVRINTIGIVDTTISQLQQDIKAWNIKNFDWGIDDRDDIAKDLFIGITEEVGELGHALLKSSQGIRGDAIQLRQEEIDAIGDIFIYLSAYCSARHISLEDAIKQTWKTVRERDWKRHPENGIDK